MFALVGCSAIETTDSLSFWQPSEKIERANKTNVMTTRRFIILAPDLIIGMGDESSRERWVHGSRFGVPARRVFPAHPPCRAPLPPHSSAISHQLPSQFCPPQPALIPNIWSSRWETGILRRQPDMGPMPDHNYFSNLIWQIANLLWMSKVCPIFRSSKSRSKQASSCMSSQKYELSAQRRISITRRLRDRAMSCSTRCECGRALWV